MKLLTHSPVLASEAINGLNIKPNGLYIDGTFGGGGHTKLILSKLNSQGHLYAIDRDPQAIKIAASINDSRFTIIPGQFSNLAIYMNKKKLIGCIDGILLDLGISTHQIDHAERGFSFMHDGPLDMRMDPTNGLSAAQWISNANEYEMYWIFKNFGEERFARRIARSIYRYKKLKKPITRTKELVDLIYATVPHRRKYNKHPATRCFQAIRIFINNELKELEQVLQSALIVLRNSGRLSVISFHSLEDRIVKRFINKYSSCKNVIPHEIPLTDAELNSYYTNLKKLKPIAKIKPTKREINHNIRARSAILRIVEKIID
ncbi:MAG: 16S rRNA (cytosine(1402)-N(4))-methyltransferase RsmH [Candidatus Dasytiphilus stammeri]